MIQGSFKGASRKIEGSSLSPMVIQSIKEVQRVFPGSFKDVLRMIQVC